MSLPEPVPDADRKQDNARHRELVDRLADLADRIERIEMALGIDPVDGMNRHHMPGQYLAFAPEEALLPVDESSQPSDIAQLRGQFPGWTFGAVWAAAGAGPDRRRIWAIRDSILLSAWTAEALAAAIRQETGS